MRVPGARTTACSSATPMARQPFNHGRGKRGRTVGKRCGKTARLLDGIEHQVELGCRGRTRVGLHGKAAHARQYVAVTPEMVVDGLEQPAFRRRVIALIPFHQQFDRQVLMVMRCDRRLLQIAQEVDERQAPLHLRAENLHVDEAADQRFRFDTRAVGHRHADADIRAPGMAVEQHLEYRPQEQRQCRVFRARPAPAAPAPIPCRGGNARSAPASEAGVDEGRTGASMSGSGASPSAPFPVVQLALRFAGLQPASLPDGVIERTGPAAPAGAAARPLARRRARHTGLPVRERAGSPTSRRRRCDAGSGAGCGRSAQAAARSRAAAAHQPG